MTGSQPVVEAEACPACSEQPGSSLACLKCGCLLEEGDQSDHYQRLGQPPTGRFDIERAEAVYLSLSRLLHPDFHGADDERTQALAVSHSALLNEAWRVLTDEQLRPEYQLELHDPGALDRHKALSPAFLMEAMELSEELEEAHDRGCKETIARIRSEAERAIHERMTGVTEGCMHTIERIAQDAHVPGAERGSLPSPLLTPHQWNTEQIATMLHQARVYRRILRDTETAGK
jgi:Fe-S protein assembly co-chaperone HscB